MGTPQAVDVTLRLNRGIPDVPWARHELLALLEHTGRTLDHDCVGLVVTELLTNALLHGQEPVTVHASTSGDVLRIEVHDASALPPRPRQPDVVDPSGRGLLLVAGLAQRWGVEESSSGKVVWAELPARRQAS